MICPIEKIHDGKCCLLRDSDLAKLTSKGFLQKVAKAESMMDGARGLVLAHASGKAQRMDLLCMHDCRLIYTLLGKGKQSREGMAYESLAAAGQVFVDQLGKLVGKQLINPWLEDESRRPLSKRQETTVADQCTQQRREAMSCARVCSL